MTGGFDFKGASYPVSEGGDAAHEQWASSPRPSPPKEERDKSPLRLTGYRALGFTDVAGRGCRGQGVRCVWLLALTLQFGSLPGVSAQSAQQANSFVPGTATPEASPGKGDRKSVV